MTGNEYQGAALRTASGMNYDHHGMIINGALGLCGESGEVADIIKKADLYVSANHVQNFCECVESRKCTITPAEVGGRSSTLCLLCNMSYQYDRGFEWDGKRMTFKSGTCTGGISDKREVYRNGWNIVV